ncbi:MAG: hypothetical protein WBM00_12695 [Solirubrobacterales bacterium]
MEAVSFLYCYPKAIETAEGRAEVADALEKLAAELKLHPPIELKADDHGQVTIPYVGPDDTWAALDRAVPDWAGRALFMPPDPEQQS